MRQQKTKSIFYYTANRKNENLQEREEGFHNNNDHIVSKKNIKNIENKKYIRKRKKINLPLYFSI